VQFGAHRPIHGATRSAIHAVQSVVVLVPAAAVLSLADRADQQEAAVGSAGFGGRSSEEEDDSMTMATAPEGMRALSMAWITAAPSSSLSGTAALTNSCC
jgi:hypothetical protein